MKRVECERCGMEWQVASIRRKVILCQSCRAKKVQTVQSPHGKCLPWAGHFAADEVTPVDDEGQPVLPGVRACGKADCVSPRHIIGYEKG
jgi:hypothetical protein